MARVTAAQPMQNARNSRHVSAHRALAVAALPAQGLEARARRGTSHLAPHSEAHSEAHSETHSEAQETARPRAHCHAASKMTRRVTTAQRHTTQPQTATRQSSDPARNAATASQTPRKLPLLKRTLENTFQIAKIHGESLRSQGNAS